NPYMHDLVAALLAPVEDIIADVTAALADPSHRPALTAPLHIGPSGDIAAGDPPDPISLPYAQGLSAGAVRLHTSASAVLMSLQAAIAKSQSANWLTAGIQRLDGELQAAGARLDMSGVRLASLVGTHTGDPAALAEICRDLWLIIGASVAAGQMLSDPHLLPEAAAAAQSSPRTPPPPVVPPPAVPPAVTTTPMAPPTAPVERVVLPDIDAGAAPLRPHREALSPDPRSPAPPADIALPVIGEPSQPPPPDPAPLNKPQPDPPRRSEAPASEADDKPSVLFPDIG
ncbi:MAG TPA: hypothetical protein VF916_02240, partial [Ktedonobacterales bacterium]